MLKYNKNKSDFYLKNIINMLTKSNTMKIERKGKNKSLIKTPSTTTRISSKKKLNYQLKMKRKMLIKFYLKIIFKKKLKKIINTIIRY